MKRESSMNLEVSFNRAVEMHIVPYARNIPTYTTHIHPPPKDVHYTSTLHTYIH